LLSAMLSGNKNLFCRKYNDIDEAKLLIDDFFINIIKKKDK